MQKYFLDILTVYIMLLSQPYQCARIRRVVGGAPLPPGTWPWLVSLNYKGQHPYLKLQGLKHLCGGTLIDKSWVMTAAHCVHFSSGSAGLGSTTNWVAVLGEYNRKIPEKAEQNVEIAGIFLKNYTIYPKLSEDIALLKLKTPARITRRVRPVPLDIDRWIPPGTLCVAAGWGQYTSDEMGEPQYGNGTMVPHMAHVKLETQEKCQEAYGNLWPLIDDRVLCFRSHLSQDTCKGDSGGPLICDTPGGQPVVTGVVSVGEGCAKEDYPGVYTRVSSYRDWIMSIVPITK